MTQEQGPNPWADGMWHEGTVSPDDDKGNGSDEYASKWAPVIMAAIVAGLIIVICLICGQTVISVVSTIWGKS